MSLQDFIAGLGLGIHTPASPTIGPNGPTSSYSSPVGPGTSGGAFLGISGGGRALQQLIGSHYGLGLGQRSWGEMFGPGGRFGHRGIGQWVSDPYGGPLAPERGPSAPSPAPTSHSTVYDNMRVAGSLLRAWASGRLSTTPQNVKTAMRDFAQFVVKAGRLIPLPELEYPVGPGGPVSPSPFYPTVEGSAGRISPEEAATMLHRLMSQQRWGASAPWWQNQWLYSPTASSTGSGGGGTSTAPERLLLGGMKHPYDWVAGVRYT
jgi:hypothetical protein